MPKRALPGEVTGDPPEPCVVVGGSRMETSRHALDGRAEKYQGEFLADKRHGRGTCIFPDGSRYTGEWKAGAERALTDATGGTEVEGG